MITVIQEDNVDYFNKDQLIYIYHNKGKKEAKVKFINGDITILYNVKKIKF